MKNYMRILTILLFSTFIIGCTNGKKNSNNGKRNSNKEIELPEESKLFNDLQSLSQILNQFEGTAFVGSLNGLCYMRLTSNSQGDNIVKLRYQINNYNQSKVDVVDETYTITGLNRKSVKKDGGGINSQDLEDIYLYGNVNGLKSSINDGAITDASGSGNIWFALDSINYELTYLMASSANWSFQGSIKLEIEDYIEFKELFADKKLSKSQVEAISKSQNILELTSNDSNFINLGNNKYKVLISKAQLIKNAKKYRRTMQNGSWCYGKGNLCTSSRIKSLFTVTIKNVSNRPIHIARIRRLYESAPESVWSNAPGSDQGLNPWVYEVFSNSSPSGGVVDKFFSKTLRRNIYGPSFFEIDEERQKFINGLSKEVKFWFDLSFQKPGYWFNYRQRSPYWCSIQPFTERNSFNI